MPPVSDRELQRILKELEKLRKLPQNKYCAECGDKGATWCSTNLGVFVCIRCSGVHRKMGTHISKVKSSTLDSWNNNLFTNFRNLGGNKLVNSYYEAKNRGHKPAPNSDSHELERFIRDKYEKKLFFSKKQFRKAQVK